ncbi:hypothetical protein GWI34_22795, partial [Actinomadura sp. DSM 109109]|nr:hypothetical protein [Actinomadura lepetitiana]
MQCPTCGNDTPGTLGKCSHCEAPIDVYSVGPALPLASPVAEAAPVGTSPAVAGGTDPHGDRTMTAPPSWASGPQTPPAADPGTRFDTVRQDAPEPPARPPLQLSAEPPSTASA